MPTPAELNYHPCARCKVLRPKEQLQPADFNWLVCKDKKVCKVLKEAEK